MLMGQPSKSSSGEENSRNKPTDDSNNSDSDNSDSSISQGHVNDTTKELSGDSQPEQTTPDLPGPLIVDDLRGSGLSLNTVIFRSARLERELKSLQPPQIPKPKDQNSGNTGKGSGKGGTKRHRKVFKDTIKYTMRAETLSNIWLDRPLEMWKWSTLLRALTGIPDTWGED
ncbi:hypothetical protein B0I72DRAFT_174524 [Yarrowia lipolytica]|nr:hypothetical protein B0I72DRAFT_174524 [Yarrowia lipolytica]